MVFPAGFTLKPSRPRVPSRGTTPLGTPADEITVPNEMRCAFDYPFKRLPVLLSTFLPSAIP